MDVGVAVRIARLAVQWKGKKMTPETFEAIKLALAAGCGSAASYILSKITRFESLSKKDKQIAVMALTCILGALLAVFLAWLGAVPMPTIPVEWFQLMYKGGSAAFIASQVTHMTKKKKAAGEAVQ